MVLAERVSQRKACLFLLLTARLSINMLLYEISAQLPYHKLTDLEKTPVSVHPLIVRVDKHTDSKRYHCLCATAEESAFHFEGRLFHVVLLCFVIRGKAE